MRGFLCMEEQQLPGPQHCSTVVHQTRHSVALCFFSDLEKYLMDHLARQESTQLAWTPPRQGIFLEASRNHSDHTCDGQVACASANTPGSADDVDTHHGAQKSCRLSCDLLAKPDAKSGQHLSVFASVEEWARGNSAQQHLVLRKGDGQELASLKLNALVVSRHWGLASSIKRIIALTASEFGACEVVYLQFHSLPCLELFGRMTGCDIE